MNEIEEIRERIDLVELVSQYVQVKRAGTNYKGVCPFHAEKTPSLMISPEKKMWKCFGCGKGGSAFDFIMELEHLEFADALKLLAKRAGVELKPRTEAEHQSKTRKDTIFRVNEFVSRVWAQALLAPSGQTALDYLKKRGLTDETIKTWRLGLASPALNLKSLLINKGGSLADLERAGGFDRFRGRIMFPIFDVLGGVIGFSGRALAADQEPKYLNTPETPVFKKSRALYGLHLAKAAIKDKGYSVLVEGQLDVLLLHQNGATSTVASSGTAVTLDQLTILSKYADNFLLAFDNDTAGLATTKKVIELILANDWSCKVVTYGEFKDAGEMMLAEPKQWPEAVKQAREGWRYLVDEAIKEVGSTQFIESKKKVLTLTLPVLQQMVDPTRREDAVNYLAQALQTRPDSIVAAISSKQAKTPRYAQPTQANSPQAAQGKPVKVPSGEGQLLILLASQPKILGSYLAKIKQLRWQEITASQVAKQLEKSYTDSSTARSLFAALEKDPAIASAVEAWQWWLDSQWPNLNPELAEELISEKFLALGERDYDARKSEIANSIARAQEMGDIKQLKQLMDELNVLTKDSGSVKEKKK